MPANRSAAKSSWAAEVEQLERERDLLWHAIDAITDYRGDTRHRAWVPAQIAVDALEALAADREAHDAG